MARKEGLIRRLRRESYEKKKKFTDSVTASDDYETLYDIGMAIRSLNTTSMAIGVSLIAAGLLMWVFTVLWPFLRSFSFHMGAGGIIGVIMMLCGIVFYLGSMRILHPLSKAVNVAKDRVIRKILAERDSHD